MQRRLTFTYPVPLSQMRILDAISPDFKSLLVNIVICNTHYSDVLGRPIILMRREMI